MLLFLGESSIYKDNQSIKKLNLTDDWFSYFYLSFRASKWHLNFLMEDSAVEAEQWCIWNTPIKKALSNK